MIEMAKTVFISGANRGIGFELTRQLMARSYQVIGGYRDETRSRRLLDESQIESNLFPFKIDVTSESELKGLYHFISSQFGHLDILINNAGINTNRSMTLQELEWQDIAQHFNVNVGGAFLVAKALYPLIKKGRQKKIINISSKLASIELNGGHSIPYSVSKAGLNMLTKNQALEYKDDGVAVVSLNPGWVKTDMGGEEAPANVEDSASQVLQVMDSLELSRSGQFIDVGGELLPY